MEKQKTMMKIDRCSLIGVSIEGLVPDENGMCWIDYISDPALYYDSNDGRFGWVPQSHFEISGSGDEVQVMTRAQFLAFWGGGDDNSPDRIAATVNGMTDEDIIYYFIED